MHEVCTILTHICNKYDVISMFYINLRGFINDPIYLGYNSAEQENPILRIFHFQGPLRRQIELGFWDVNISSREPAGAPGPHEEGSEAQTRHGGAPSKGRGATTLFFTIDHLIRSNLMPNDFVLT
jgi:hypothetical protein